MDEGYDALTEKEREALRLMVRGHDAKSMARSLSLSVHTINDRLRAARRKLGVTSSREAARLVLEREGGTPQILADKDLGDATEARTDDPLPITKGIPKRTLLIGGTLVMFSIAIVAALALGAPGTDRPVGDPATSLETVQLDAFESTARDWLTLVDAFDWDGSFAAAGRPFRDPNTVDIWRDASQQVRVPLGKMLDREVTTVDLIQSGKDEESAKDQVIVRFVTQFENRADVQEQVTLEQEHGEWKVMGYVID